MSNEMKTVLSFMWSVVKFAFGLTFAVVGFVLSVMLGSIPD